MWTAPGRIQVKGKDVTGFIAFDEEGYRFIANKFGKNSGLVVAPLVAPLFEKS
jgi:hypothetical protein